MGSVAFGLLGPIEVTVDGRRLALGGPRIKAILAALLLEPGQVVRTERIIETVWDDRPPVSARTQVHIKVSALRRALGTAGISERIGTTSGGYLVRAGSDEIDAVVFESQLDQVYRYVDRAQYDDALSTIVAALQHWRGRALDGVDCIALRPTAGRLDERRLSAFELRADLQLHAGKHAAAIGELTQLCMDHTWHEGLASRLMVALHRSGRTGEALDRYERTRRTIADELGIDVSQALTDLHSRMLRGDPDGWPQLGEHPLAAERTSVRQPAAASARFSTPPRYIAPAQLPMNLREFHGRVIELAQLDTLVEPPAGQRNRPVLMTLTGMPGVGKTALAVHWGHRRAAEFPDGHLYVDLRAFGPDETPRRPGDVLHDFLEALGVPASEIPAGEPARSGLFRSILAHRQTLVLLDNAADAGQVRPLLPGGARCRVVVTSRNRLTGLTATAGGATIVARPFDLATARQMLETRIGSDRVAAEPAAVEDIVSRCAGLPLALAAIAARATTHPTRTLSTLAEELHNAANALNPTHDTDPVTNVRATLSWSYDALSAEAARLFRLLSVAPGIDLGLPAMASIVALTPSQLDDVVAELVNASMLNPVTADRYSMHDLLRIFAAELAESKDDATVRRATTRRLLDHYLTTAATAATLLQPHQPAIAIEPPVHMVTSSRLVDHEAALRWLTVERRQLLACVSLAYDNGFDRHAWQLARCLTTFLNRRGRWANLVAVHEIALRAARRSGDRQGQMHAHFGIGSGLQALGQLPSAVKHSAMALRLSHIGCDKREMAFAHMNLAIDVGFQEQYALALQHMQQALMLYEAVDDRPGQARALHHIGWYFALLEDHGQAIKNCRRAIAQFEALDDRSGLAPTWHSLGYAYHQAGRHGEAIECYRQAVHLHHALGDLRNLCEHLVDYADALHMNGDLERAKLTLQKSLAIMEKLGHRQTEHVRDRLASLAA